jgi:long-chain acyl-CoA synthetase
VLSAYEDACQLLLIEDCAQGLIDGGRFPDFGVVEPTAPVMYQFSSGSTGRPKRIARTHGNLIFELKSLVQTLGITAEDRFIGVTPFSHVNGLMRSMMTSVFAGATLYPVARFDRHSAVEMIENHRISVFIGVPFMFGIMARTNYGRSPDFSRLRLCVSASAPKVKALLLTNAPCAEVEIIDHCRGKIAEFKIPSIIEFRDDFPKSPTGKVRRELLS